MTSTPDQHGADVREYVRVIRVRKFEILLVVAVLVSATMIFSFKQMPIFEGTAKVLVRPIQPATTSAAITQQPNLDTERELVASQPVAQQVRADTHVSISLDDLLKNLRVQVVTDTEILLVKFDDPDRATAAQLSNAFALAYVNFRTQQATDQYTAAATAVQRRIDGVQQSLAELKKRINATDDPSAKDSLGAQRDTLIAQLGVLQQRLLDLQANSSVAQGAAEIVQRAEVPLSPVRPNKVRNGTLALFLGLVLGTGLAFLRERLDDRIKTHQEIERALGAPVLAVVPRIGSWTRNDQALLVSWTDPKSPASEAYRTLATNIQYAASLQPLKVIMVTSSLGGDGKSSTSSNLAVALARAGKRVILVSADLRKPRIHKFFRLPNDVGLSSLLSDRTQLAAAHKNPGISNLRVITGGAVPNDPAALLGGRRVKEFVRWIRGVADFAIIDTPPVLAVADASILAPMADGVVFVLNGDQCSRSALIQALDQLENAGANIIGAVFNNFDPSQSSAYSYYQNYDNYYGSEEGSGRNGNGTKLGGRLVRRSRRLYVSAGSSNGSQAGTEDWSHASAWPVTPEGSEAP